MNTKEFIEFMIVIIVLIMMFGGLFALLWNVIMPYMFGLPTIGIGRGIAFYLLFRLVVSGMSVKAFLR